MEKLGSVLPQLGKVQQVVEFGTVAAVGFVVAARPVVVLGRIVVAVVAELGKIVEFGLEIVGVVGTAAVETVEVVAEEDGQEGDQSLHPHHHP